MGSKSVAVLIVCLLVASCGVPTMVEIRSKGYSAYKNRNKEVVIALSEERVNELGGPSGVAASQVLKDAAVREGYCERDKYVYETAIRNPRGWYWQFIGRCAS